MTIIDNYELLLFDWKNNVVVMHKVWDGAEQLMKEMTGKNEYYAQFRNMNFKNVCGLSDSAPIFCGFDKKMRLSYAQTFCGSAFAASASVARSIPSWVTQQLTKHAFQTVVEGLAWTRKK